MQPRRTSSPSEPSPPSFLLLLLLLLPRLPACHSGSQRCRLRLSRYDRESQSLLSGGSFLQFSTVKSVILVIACLRITLLASFGFFFFFSFFRLFCFPLLPSEPLLSRDGRQLVIAVIPVSCQSEGHRRRRSSLMRERLKFRFLRAKKKTYSDFRKIFFV